MMNSFRSVTIIGYGAVGSALTDFFRHSDITLHSVWDRKPEVTLISDGKELKPAGKQMPASADETGELILISVPDNAITEVAEKLSRLPGDWSEKSVAHLSGSLPAAILGKLKEKGANIASIHPLQTFSGTGSRVKLRDIHFTLQGDEVLLDKLDSLIEMMGSSAVKVDHKQKKLLHLTAVFASNYMISLLDMANEIAESGEVENSLELMKPILRETLQNVLKDGTENSLSGPVARGDSGTIAGHIEILKNHEELLHTYRLLGKRALQIAKQNDRFTPEKEQELMNLFKHGE